MDDLVKRLNGELLDCKCAARSSGECCCGTVWPEDCTKEAADRIKDLEKQLAECLRDGEEQARLLGMSGSREAKLLAQIDEFRRERDSLLELKPNADMRELRAACQMALDALIDFHKYGVSSYYAQEAIPKLQEVLK